MGFFKPTIICNYLDDDDLASQSMASNRSEESKLGFNMCECGFEGIAIKVAKRSSNQDEYPQELASGILSVNHSTTTLYMNYDF